MLNLHFLVKCWAARDTPLQCCVVGGGMIGRAALRLLYRLLVLVWFHQRIFFSCWLPANFLVMLDLIFWFWICTPLFAGEIWWLAQCCQHQGRVTHLLGTWSNPTTTQQKEVLSGAVYVQFPEFSGLRKDLECASGRIFWS